MPLFFTLFANAPFCEQLVCKIIDLPAFQRLDRYQSELSPGLSPQLAQPIADGGPIGRGQQTSKIADVSLGLQLFEQGVVRSNGQQRGGVKADRDKDQRQ